MVENEMKKITSLIKNNRGATAIEYGLIVSFVALALTTMLFTFGDTISDTFDTVGTTMEATQPTP